MMSVFLGLALKAWAGATKRAEGHIWTASGQMVLCFHTARVTWEAICREGAEIRDVMKNDLRRIVSVLKMQHIWVCGGGYTQAIMQTMKSKHIPKTCET